MNYGAWIYLNIRSQIISSAPTMLHSIKFKIYYSFLLRENLTEENIYRIFRYFISRYLFVCTWLNVRSPLRSTSHPATVWIVLLLLCAVDNCWCNQGRALATSRQASQIITSSIWDDGPGHNQPSQPRSHFCQQVGNVVTFTLSKKKLPYNKTKTSI